MDKALTPDEVWKVTGKKGNMVTYNQIQDYPSIDKLLRNNRCLILIQTHDEGPNIITGHYICLLKKGKNIYFFDSYGTMIDYQHYEIDEEYSKQVDQDYPALSELLLNCPYTIHYNNKHLQAKREGVATCGRWTGLFMRYNIPVEQFSNKFMNLKKNGYDIDQIVVDISNKYLY